MKTVLGIERVDEFRQLFDNKRVGLITNPTGIDSNFKTSIDILKETTNLVSLFSPEHGIRGNLQAGVHLDTYVDEKTNATVFSLYGKTRKPNEEMMSTLDVLAMDIQDGGSRFYTYIYTMAYAMMACKEFDKEFVIFDRPGPIGVKDFEGNILDIEYRSFVGYYPILQRYGMTIGELAYMFNEEFGIGCKLHIIPMKNYNRDMLYSDTKLPWVAPSPNFPTVETAYVYNGTCIFEGTNLSEGRGTTKPFEIVGAPWIDGFKYAEELNKLNLPGVYFRPFYFTPMFSKCEKELCGGVQLHILDLKLFKPVKTGWAMLKIVRDMYPNDFKINAPYVEGRPCMLDYNTGGDFMRKDIHTLEELFAIIERDTAIFAKTREKYLLY
ncbi:MAG TPA: DUF1343 domain-containing protein [Bacilli bacterium]|nr:DUF1343 domain-containing protein [Bacilli bacterium]